jgi:hypothetical protein
MIIIKGSIRGWGRKSGKGHDEKKERRGRERVEGERRDREEREGGVYVNLNVVLYY